jgi:hypothetical protein
MGDDGELAALGRPHFLCGFDHGVCSGFGIGLGVEAAEGKAQCAVGIASADTHCVKNRGAMQGAGVAGGTGGAGDARLIEQNEHACRIDFGQAE